MSTRGQRAVDGPAPQRSTFGGPGLEWLEVLAGAEVFVEDLEAGQAVPLNGQTLTVIEVGSGFGLDTEDHDFADARITMDDIEASNSGVPMMDPVPRGTNDRRS